MAQNHYGLVFRQIREQKKLPLSFFEKVGIRKSSISKFERGDSMMGFERIYVMLEAMDTSLEEYELLLNRFTPTFQEEFFIELENAELHRNEKKLQKLYEEVNGTSNFFLSLIVKSKISPLSNDEVQRILLHLYTVSYWGYFELSLLQATLDNISLADAKKVFDICEDKVSKYRGVFKYTRKIYQIAYQFVLVLSVKGEKHFAEEILSKTKVDGFVDFDFFISNLRKLVIGFTIYCFEDKETGTHEMNNALAFTADLGGDDLRKYYQSRIDFFISKLDNTLN